MIKQIQVMVARFRKWLVFVQKNVGVLSTFLLGIVSSISSYYLYQYLNKESMSIKSVVISPKNISLALDWNTANEISNSESSFDDNEDLLSKDYKSIDKSAALKFLRKFNNESKNYVRKLQIINAALMNANSIKDSVKIESIAISPIYSELRLNPIRYYNAGVLNTAKWISRQRLIDQIMPLQKRYIGLQHKSDSLLALLTSLIINTQESNKANFQIECVVFNAGNTQSVVRHRGMLTIGSIHLNLKKVFNSPLFYSEDIKSKNPITESSNYLICEPKSFQVLNLEIDEFNNNKSDVEIAKRNYLNGQQKAILVLYDINNTEIAPFVFTLQSDIEINPNEELIKYIDSELSQYKNAQVKRY